MAEKSSRRTPRIRVKQIVPGQGSYYNPDFISLKPNGKRQTKRFPGYATDAG